MRLDARKKIAPASCCRRKRAPQMPGGMRGKPADRIFEPATRPGMPPKGDLPAKPCDTMPVPEKWPSG